MKIIKQTLNKSIIRTLLFIIIIDLGLLLSGLHAQTCTKTVAGTQEKCITEKMADYAWNGNLDSIKLLVNKNNELVNIRLKNEETMLTIACWQGNFNIVEYLLSKNANVNNRNKWDNTALHNAAQKGYNDIIPLLISKGAAIHAKGSEGNNCIAFAATNDHLESLKLFFKAGCAIDEPNDYGNTPLHQASWRGLTEVIRFLVENGADVNYATQDGNTVVHNLAGQGYIEALQIVLEHGGNANIADSDGRIPLHNALISIQPDAVPILLPKTQNINLQEKQLGNTPLHIAAINGDLKSTELLIKSGAKTDIRNNAQKLPVDYAVQYGYVDLVNYYVSNSLASKDMLTTAKENQSSGVVSVNNGEAKVIYTGHSGWTIETEKHVLIFDYMNLNKPSQPGLANGSICPKEIAGKDVIVFVSHDHGDHYDTCIYAWAKEVKSISYVYGFKPEEAWVNKEKGYHGPEYVYINDNQTMQVDNTTVTTLKSNDSGQGFLVTADGVTIYHPGDHALFTAEDEAGFKKEVDFIASQGKQVDIAFLPVTGCPSRWKKEFIVEGFFYSIDKLKPAEVFPMHALQREYTLKEFAELADQRMVKNPIVCVSNPGDSYIYPNTMVVSNNK